MSADAAPTRLTLYRDAGGRFGGAVRRAWGRRWVRILAYLAAIPVILYFLLWLLFARNLPSAETLLTYQPPLPTNVRGIDGEPVQTFARERRVELSYDEFPQPLIDAFTSAEDKTFFTHGGIDYPGLVGAVGDYISKVGSGARARGGSTITQQVAKNLLLGDEYSVTRKIKEAFLARRIESVLTKQQILGFVSQPDLPRAERLWRAGGGPGLFRQGCRTAPASRSGLSRHPPQGAEQLRPAAAHPARARPAQLGARRDGAQRQDQRLGSAPRPRPSRSAPPRFASNSVRNVGGYFVEEVRRQLMVR